MEAGKENKPTRCNSCGGGEFTLLISGKYKCKYCGSEQLPSAINVQKVSLESSLKGSSKAFKLIIPIIVALFALGIGAFFLTQKPIAEKVNIESLRIAQNELLAQQDRSLSILRRNSSAIKKKYKLKLPKKLNSSIISDVIGELSSQELDEFGMRLLDDLNGALNRESVARRSYRNAYSEALSILKADELKKKGFYSPDTSNDKLRTIKKTN